MAAKRKRFGSPLNLLSSRGESKMRKWHNQSHLMSGPIFGTHLALSTDISKLEFNKSYTFNVGNS